MPVDHRALGFESEEALVDALRARFGVPDHCAISIHQELVDGQIVFTLLVTAHGRAQTVSRDERS